MRWSRGVASYTTLQVAYGDGLQRPRDLIKQEKRWLQNCAADDTRPTVLQVAGYQPQLFTLEIASNSIPELFGILSQSC